MRKGSDVIGKPVLVFATGRREHKIQDVLFDHLENMVLGFLVDDGGWFGTARVVPLERVKSIGDDAVIIPDEESIQSADQYPKMRAVLEQENVLKGTKLMTEGGKELGKLVDIAFDEVSGRVEEYEVSGGMFADAYSGRSSVPASEGMRIGQDVAFVPDSVYDLMKQQQDGGIKGVAQAATDKVKDAADGAKDAVHGAVTPERKEVAKEKASNMAEAARNTVQDMAEKVKEDFKAVKSKAVEYKDKATHDMEESRIKKAVGRPVNRVILDHDNKVVLNTGDVITFESVDKAREAGVLDMLLGSVYTQEPQLNKEDMRVKDA